MKRPALHIAVVGAGVGGLASAALLARAGHRVRLFERFESARPLGAGLLLQPTGLAVLAALGLDGAVLGLGRRIEHVRGETVRGRRVLDISYRDLAATAHGLGIHRGALFGALLAAARAQGVMPETATEMVSAPPAGAGRQLLDAAGNSHGPFDLVVDASGMRSALRRAHAVARLDRDCPYGALWTVLEEPADWPDKRALTQRYVGAHTMVGVLPIGRSHEGGPDLVALFWSLRTRSFGAWQAEGLAAWRERVAATWPAARTLVEGVRDASEVAFASYADMALTSPIGDRLVHIGDAGRTASPQLGQGANLALLDAWTLADTISRYATLAVALEGYARARRDQTRFYGFASRWLTPLFQSDSVLAGGLRDAILGPAQRSSWVRHHMLATLAGVKTGPFASMNPGAIDARYTLSVH